MFSLKDTHDCNYHLHVYKSQMFTYSPDLSNEFLIHFQSFLFKISTHTSPDTLYAKTGLHKFMGFPSPQTILTLDPHIKTKHPLTDTKPQPTCWVCTASLPKPPFNTSTASIHRHHHLSKSHESSLCIHQCLSSMESPTTVHHPVKARIWGGQFMQWLSHHLRHTNPTSKGLAQVLAPQLPI